MSKKNYLAPLEIPDTPGLDELEIAVGKYNDLKSTVAKLRASIDVWQKERKKLTADQTGDPATLAKQVAELTIKIAEAESEITIWLARRKPAADALGPLIDRARTDDRKVESAFASYRMTTAENILSDSKVKAAAELIKAAIDLAGPSIVEMIGLDKYSIERGQFPDERESVIPDVDLRRGIDSRIIDKARAIKQFHRDNRKQLTPDMKSEIEFA